MKFFIKRKRRIQPRITVSRSRQNYAKEQGWKDKSGGWFGSSQLEGYYRTKFGSFKGQIKPDSLAFYIFKPPKELKNHSHWACFSHRGGGKYSIHFSVRPNDIDSGILMVERILHESFTQNSSH
jgi:hypothetical protein